MRSAPATFAIVLAAAAPLDAGEVRFGRPFTIEDVTRPVTVAAGDLNGDGKLDLVAASGSGLIEIFLQDPLSRTVWQKSEMKLGIGTFMVRTADLDGDGHVEILAADPATTAHVVPNRGGVFEKAVPLPPAASARWIAVGDWNRDGSLDAATADFDRANVAVFLGDGTGALTHSRTYGLPEPHSVEGADHDGDGDLDLMVGYGDMGLRLLDGKGDGTFGAPRSARGLTPCGRFVSSADFNQDGKGDAALTCLRDSPQGVIGTVIVGISQGDGSFKPGLDATTRDIASLAAGDWNGDGRADVAQVSVDNSVLLARLGKGDGTFSAEVPFGPTGIAPTFVLAADLDADGRQDLITADAGSSTLTVFWGKDAEQLFESGKLTTGHAGAAAVVDLDGDGALDFVFPRTNPPGVDLYLNPGTRSSSRPDLKIPTEAAHNSLTVADLNGDATPDLAGVNVTNQKLYVELLDASAVVVKQFSFQTGKVPSGLEAGRLDDDDTLDLAVPCLGSNEISVFLGLGRGDFAAAAAVATMERPRLLVLGDIDADGRLDMALTALGVVAVHFGEGAGAFTEPVVVLRNDPPRTYLDLALGDVTGDSLPDLLVTAPGAPELLLLRGRGNRAFDDAAPLKLSGTPRSIFLADLNQDGLLDIAASGNDSSVSFIFNRGKEGLEPALRLRGGLPLAVDLRLVDLTRHGRLDLALFAPATSFVFEGLPPEGPPPGTFRRGDADSNGKVEITDAIALLRFLFSGEESLCEDASDADDDGRLSLTDALGIVRWLFQGSPPPGAPGPELCGVDPTEDGLASCDRACR